jgi:hypothetical protein
VILAFFTGVSVGFFMAAFLCATCRSEENEWRPKMTDRETVEEPKTFRVIVIDPDARSITEQHSPGTLADIHALVQDKNGLDSFRIADHPMSWDYGWVDDRALMRGEPVHAFLFDIMHDPIAGRCLLLGVDKETRGNADANFPLPVLRKTITFLGLIKPEVTWVAEATGARAVVTYERVRL